MPTSKKISELNEFTIVNPNDIVPIVDYTLTQTGKVTASKIAALGGGTPGTNTVSNPVIKTGGINASKLGFGSANKIAYSSASTSVDGVTAFSCLETPLTSYARTLIAAPDATAAWSLLSASPNFSGPISVPNGTAATPSYGFSGAFSTGLFCVDDSVAISSRGKLLYLFSNARDMYSLQPGAADNQLTPAIPVRAYSVFTQSAGAATVTLGRARDVGTFFGFSTYQNINGEWNGPNIWNGVPTGSTYTIAAALTAACTAKGVTYSSHQSSDADGRSNYTSPTNNSLIVLTAAGTSTPLSATGVPYDVTPADQKSWVGTMTYTTSATAPQILSTRNVSSITARSGGGYVVNFSVPMPDANYGVIGHVRPTGGAGGYYGNITVITKSQTSCEVAFGNNTTIRSTAGDEYFVAVVR
jgi:hypothetical protein